MGSLCWKAISMDKLSLLIILISFGQDNLLSATTSHEKVESLVDHLDMKFSQMMKNQKDQQEEIKQLQEENKELTEQLGEQINHVSSLTELVDSLTNKSIDHEKSINVLRSPPAVFYCGYRFNTYATRSVITFDRLSYSNNNQPTGGLDPATGKFSCPYPGTYSVSWSLFASNDAVRGDDSVEIHLKKNGGLVGHESTHLSSYTGASGGVGDQGSRTLIIDLLLGDTLSMYCLDCSATVYYVNFCVSLVH